MPLDKLPVPTLAELQLQTSDVGSVFQGKMNASVIALRNALIAYNNQIDAAVTASQQVEPAPADVALAGANNTYKMTPLLVKQVMAKYGLGSSIVSIPDLGAPLAANYFFGAGTTVPGLPPGFIDVLGINLRYDNDYQTQIVTDLTGSEMAFRGKQAGGAWKKLYHSRNVVGPVSFNSGFNTGAIIEHGSNINGQYTKFADGTLFCWFTTPGYYPPFTNDTAANLVYSNNLQWTFPAAFVGLPLTMYTPGCCDFAIGPTVWPVSAGRLTGSQPTTVGDNNIYIIFSKMGGTAAQLRCYAIGRWRV